MARQTAQRILPWPPRMPSRTPVYANLTIAAASQKNSCVPNRKDDYSLHNRRFQKG
jgi:hypothetical protein